MNSTLGRTELFILTYAAFIISTVFVLGFLGVTRLDIYLAAFAVEYFAVIPITGPHGPAETERQLIIGAMVLTVFIVIAAERILQLAV